MAFSPDGQVVFYSGQLNFSSEDQLIKKIKKQAKKKKAAKLIFGLPLDKQGQPTDQSRWVKEIARRLAKETGLEIDFFDEYLTTWQAQRNLNRLDRVDQEAARIILKEYLNQND